MNEQQQTETQLEKEGWKFATLTGGDHLKRTLEMYRELGIETSLLEVDPEKCGTCTQCFVTSGEKLYRVYIKPAKN